MPSHRALLIVIDSVGIGSAPDADAYGDEGANTVGHILDAHPDLKLHALTRMGLIKAMHAAAGKPSRDDRPSDASWGWMHERSKGKDTTTGHWEIAGVPVDQPFAVFESFPPRIIAPIESASQVEFIGNYARSGTVILEELGEQHVQTGKPILYTSADSVLQIAAHEEIIPLDRLYAICREARAVADRHRIGRVIARPFIGEPGDFQRTTNRKDFSMLPPRTVLSALTEGGIDVLSVGKINDIFAGQGITTSYPTKSNAEGMTVIDRLWNNPGTANPHLIFVNLVDFDMLYGHRRDGAGYAAALKAFDAWLDQFLPKVRSDDLVIITADHGNDPTWTGADHTREAVPLLVRAPGSPTELGARRTFADIAASLAQWFNLPPWPTGRGMGFQPMIPPKTTKAP